MIRELSQRVFLCPDHDHWIWFRSNPRSVWFVIRPCPKCGFEALPVAL